MAEFFKSKNLPKTTDEFHKYCKKVMAGKCQIVEEKTREQAKNVLWREMAA